MSRSSTATLLSLDRYARILGLNPIHFNGAMGDVVWPLVGGSCRDVWPQHPWQSIDIISREELGRQLHLSEISVMRALGYSAAPTWIAAEEHNYPKHYNRGWEPMYSYPRNLTTKYRHVIAGGRRAADLIAATVSVVYSDSDGDGFFETATVTVPGVTTTDAREIRLFTTGKLGRPEWEIRPLRSAALVGGVFTAVFDSWLAINPTLWEFHPQSSELDPINITTTANYVTTVDAYRVYNSTVEAPMNFYNGIGFYCYECSNVGCEACSQTGCLLVENGEFGRVIASPAAYEDDVWVTSVCRSTVDARTVKLWYYSGYRSQDYLSGLSDDPLDDLLAEAIAMLTTARLSKPVCSCSNVRLMADDLRRDFAFSTKDSFNLIWRNGVVQTNPFGTKAGEVRAWKIVNELIGDAVIGGVM